MTLLIPLIAYHEKFQKSNKKCYFNKCHPGLQANRKIFLQQSLKDSQVIHKDGKFHTSSSAKYQKVLHIYI